MGVVQFPASPQEAAQTKGLPLWQVVFIAVAVNIAILAFCMVVALGVAAIHSAPGTIESPKTEGPCER
jgi:hypothetical protein